MSARSLFAPKPPVLERIWKKWGTSRLSGPAIQCVVPISNGMARWSADGGGGRGGADFEGSAGAVAGEIFEGGIDSQLVGAGEPAICGSERPAGLVLVDADFAVEQIAARIDDFDGMLQHRVVERFVERDHEWIA